MRRVDDVDREPDIVLVILQRVRLLAPNLTDEQALQIEQAVRADFGGMRVRVAKRKKHPSPEQRRKVFAEALTDASNDEITERNGISRRTLYRYLKRGDE